jgi:hypothetical protein
MNTIASLQEKLYVKHEQNQQEDLGNGQNKSRFWVLITRIGVVV